MLVDKRGSRAKGHEWPLDARKSKETNCFLGSLEMNTSYQSFDLAQ